MSREKVYIVDENDQIVGEKWRDELTPRDRIRITAVWLENSKGEVLLAQRSPMKHVNPSKWGPAAAGCVNTSETYQENAQKELAEEIGVTDLELKHLQKVVYRNDTVNGNNRVCSWFYGVTDRRLSDFTLQDEEVNAIRWISKQDLAQELHERPEAFVGSSQNWAELFDL